MTTTVDELEQPRITVSEISDSAIHSAFQGFVEDVVAEKMQDNLRTGRWFWPNGTYRENGDYVPPGFRDKVDTAELLNSQKVRHG